MRLNKKNNQALFLLFLFLLIMTSISFITIRSENNNFNDNSVFLSAPEDPYEYNDDFDNATDIRFLEAQWLSDYLGNGSQWNDDWYMIKLDQGEERLRVELIFNSSEGDIDIAIYDWNYNYIGGNYSSGDNEYFEQDIFPNGIYYLKVYGDNAGNSYNLWWEDLMPYDDYLEKNGYMEENDDIGSPSRVYSEYYHKLKIVPWDEDWFEIYLNSGDIIDIRIFFNHSDGNLQLELYDRFDIMRIGSYSSNDNEFISSFTIDTEGDWRIRVYHADNNSDVFYDLDIITGDDWREDNDDYWISYYVDPGFYKDLVILGGDDDWFDINLNNGDTINISIFFNHIAGDLQLELYSPDDNTNPIRRSLSTDNNEFIFFAAASSGNWRIHVYNRYGNSNVHYDMDIWVYRGDDMFEPNDDFSSAVPVGPIYYDNLVLLHGNEDWFLFHLDIGDTIEVRIEFWNGNLDLELYDPYNITRIGSYSTYNYDENIYYTADVSGDWRIRVYHAGNDFDVYYSMDIWGPDWMEDNDDYGSAQWVENRRYEDLNIMGADDDWFRIFLNAGDFVDVRIFFNSYEGSLKFKLYDHNDYMNERYISENYGDEESIHREVDISGDWFIQIYHNFGGPNVRYTMEIRINNTIIGDDPYESNNYFEEAYDLSDDEGKWLSEIHGLAVQGDEDWYMIEIYPGFQHLMVNLTYNRTSQGFIEINLYQLWDVYNPDSNLIYSNHSITGNNTAVINCQYIEGGIYFIQVDGSSLDVKYDLWWDDFRTDHRLDDNYEENDNLDSAYDLTSYEDTWLSSIDGYGVQKDDDWYKIQVQSGRQHLIVVVKYDHQEGAIGIEIKDWLGSDVIQNYTAEDDVIISYNLPSNGTYYIRIFGDRSRNIYSLSWYTIEPPEEMIPGYDIFIIFGAIFGIGVVITLKWKRNKK